MSIAGDRAGKSHWDATWNAVGTPKNTQVDGPGRWNHVNRVTARLLRRWLVPKVPGGRILELGCARSIWLPYFKQQLGYEITGLDYSELGCDLARKTLQQAGVSGEVVLGDFFNPPSELAGQFAAAFSYGVAEHFDDTAGCIRAFSRFLTPSGRLITIIPNMTGVPGFLQKHINRPVFEKHVPLDSARLSSAHRAAGLTVLESGYLTSTNFGVMNLTGLRSGSPSWMAKRLFLAALARVSLLSWMAEPTLRPGPTWGGYVYCVADRANESSPS